MNSEQDWNLDSSEVVVLFPVRVHHILPITPTINCAHDHTICLIPAKSMASINQRWNARPLSSLTNYEAIRSTHGAVDVVGEVGCVVDGGEHAGLHLLLVHVRPGNLFIQKPLVYSLLLTWVLPADLRILHQKRGGLLSLRFHTGNVGKCQVNCLLARI